MLAVGQLVLIGKHKYSAGETTHYHCHAAPAQTEEFTFQGEQSEISEVVLKKKISTIVEF